MKTIVSVAKESFHMNRYRDVFFYLLLLTTFFLLLEVSFFIQCNQAYLADFAFMSDHLPLPMTILPGILFFLLAQLSVHLAYCLFVWAITVCLTALGGYFSHRMVGLSIVIWSIGLLTVLTANQYFFPNSKFAELTYLVLFHPILTQVVWVTLALLCSGIVFLAGVGLLKILIKTPYLWVLTVSFLLLGGWLKGQQHFQPQQPLDAATPSKPNIILVGIDSLRPDFLSYFGHEQATPFFDGFLHQATVFSDAMTPLARTFPSWSSLLTGEYPRETGIRFNLAPQQGLHLADTLPAILQRHGYETIYATDETRFSNIDRNFGFDTVIAPPMGLNDFLIGTFNDFPLSNLLVNSRLGQWLFPYSYANRPAYFSYDPDCFIRLIQSALPMRRHKPLFLAIHFCLPHYPYLWAGLSGRVFHPLARYEASVVRVDQQLNDFFVLLKRYQLLKHAIVVLLSDHGEAFELPGDRITKPQLFVASRKRAIPHFYPPSLDQEKVDQSAGHGTDVLGLSQYHTVLAFRFYGRGPQVTRVISDRVSLLDVKPTLLQLLSFSAPQTSGQSLAAMLTNRQVVLTPHEHIFLESDYTPAAIRTVYPETRQILLEGIHLFQVNPVDTRLTVKEQMGRMIVHSKQYADIYGQWMLALYPEDQQHHLAILVHLTSGQWTDDLRSSFAQHSPAVRMLTALRTFYGSEIGQISTHHQ
jgi:arylsulfatase A-like enzyme